MGPRRRTLYAWKNNTRIHARTAGAEVSESAGATSMSLELKRPAINEPHGTNDSNEDIFVVYFDWVSFIAVREMTRRCLCADNQVYKVLFYFRRENEELRKECESLKEQKEHVEQLLAEEERQQEERYMAQYVRCSSLRNLKTRVLSRVET